MKMEDQVVFLDQEFFDLLEQARGLSKGEDEFKLEFRIFEENKKLSYSEFQLKKNLRDDLHKIIEDVFKDDQEIKYLPKPETTIYYCKGKYKYPRLSSSGVLEDNHCLYFKQIKHHDYFSFDKIRITGEKIKLGLEKYLGFGVEMTVVEIV